MQNTTTNSHSDINIGVIGPEELVTQIHKALKGFPNFRPIYHVIDYLADNESIAKELMEAVEVLLFIDFYSYNYFKELVHFSIPAQYIPLMGTGLYRSLSIIKSRYNLEVLSIDTVEEKYVKQIISELADSSCHLLEYEGKITPSSIHECVKFHKHNYLKYKSTAVTGNEKVACQLKGLGVPYEWMVPTQQDMIVALERAILSTNTRRNKESQIVFGLINIDNFKGTLSRYSSEHDIQLLNLNIQQTLLDYIRQLDGHLINMGGEEYLFITTRGIFERQTRGYKFLPILQKAKSDLDITLSVGIGFGLSAAEAGNHARLALYQSKESGGNVCYIVREDRSVLGPVDITSDKQYEKYDLAITDPALLDKAEKAGMSASYMTKIMGRVSRHQKIDYTAQELAATLKVTIRSAHRILLKWMDADLVEIIGEEKMTHKGRPRRIYRLSFIDENDLSKYS